MAATAMINSGPRDNGHREQAAAEGEDGARRRVASRRADSAGGRRSAPAGSRPSRPVPADDPAPAVRARRARARCRSSRPTSSPIACAPPAAPAREVLLEVRDAVRVGVTTDELDRICHEACIARGGYPSPLALQGLPEVAVHVGERDHLPRDPRRPRACKTATSSTATSRSTCTASTATCSETFLVGDVDDVGRRPRAGRPRSRSGKASTRCKPGGRIYEIGRAIQDARRSGRLRRRALVRRPRCR